jgi:hypothetical protein
LIRKHIHQSGSVEKFDSTENKITPPIISEIHIDRRDSSSIHIVRLRILGSRMDLFESSLLLERIRQDLMLHCKYFRDNYFKYSNKVLLIPFNSPKILQGNSQNKHKEQKKEISPKLDFQIFVRELKNPETSSHYLASLIVEELEKRTPFRRAMRFRVEQVQNIPRIRGIRIQISGRLIGAEIARTEWTRKGQVPLHTISANLDYSAKAASTIYGLLGVKVWIFIT